MVGYICFHKSRRDSRFYPTRPGKARSYFKFRGMSSLTNAEMFAGFGRTPGGKMKWPRRSASVTPRQAFYEEGFEAMLAPTLEECPHCMDVSHRVGVEENHIVELGRHLLQVRHNLIDSLDEAPGGALLPLGMTSHSCRPAVRGTVSFCTVT